MARERGLCQPGPLATEDCTTGRAPRGRTRSATHAMHEGSPGGGRAFHPPRYSVCIYCTQHSCFWCSSVVRKCLRLSEFLMGSRQNFSDRFLRVISEVPPRPARRVSLETLIETPLTKSPSHQAHFDDIGCRFRQMSYGRVPVTRKRVPDREEPGKPRKDARRGRCHTLE